MLAESVGKALEFLGKYFWAIFITSAFVLFIPDEIAQQIGIRHMRNIYKGYLWVMLVLSGALWVGAVFQFINKRILDGWLEKCTAKKSLVLRLRSLRPDELMWIKYCLFHNTQTLCAYQTNRTAHSLVDKGILEEGSGSILDLPFHFPDYVWSYLLKHKKVFLPPTETTDKNFLQALAQFQKSLHGFY